MITREIISPLARRPFHPDEAVDHPGLLNTAFALGLRRVPRRPAPLTRLARWLQPREPNVLVRWGAPRRPPVRFPTAGGRATHRITWRDLYWCTMRALSQPPSGVHMSSSHDPKEAQAKAPDVREAGDGGVLRNGAVPQHGRHERGVMRSGSAPTAEQVTMIGLAPADFEGLDVLDAKAAERASSRSPTRAMRCRHLVALDAQRRVSPVEAIAILSTVTGSRARPAPGPLELETPLDAAYHRGEIPDGP